MLIENLKRCPFCGVAPTTDVDYYSIVNDKLMISFSVICPKCHTMKTVTKEVGGESFEQCIVYMNEAIKLWNHRVNEKD